MVPGCDVSGEIDRCNESEPKTSMKQGNCLSHIPCCDPSLFLYNTHAPQFYFNCEDSVLNLQFKKDKERMQLMKKSLLKRRKVYRLVHVHAGKAITIVQHCTCTNTALPTCMCAL